MNLLQNISEGGFLYLMFNSNSIIPYPQNQDEKLIHLEKWDKMKAQSQLLAERLLSFHPDSPLWPIGERMNLCASTLFFGYTEDGERRLRNTSYCRARLCPVCQWRRSLKVRGQMTEILEHVERAQGLRYIMLTLTVKNCCSADLRPTLKTMLRAWGRLTSRAWFKKICLGVYRAIEVSINPLDKSCHPHIHAVLAVRPGYFSGRDYIKTEEWAQRWQEALELPYTPIVHLAALRKPFEKSAAEIAKYSLKVSNLIELLNEIPNTMLADLHWGLSGLRLFSLSGVFRQAHKELHLSDMDDPQGEEENADASFFDDIVIPYFWNAGLSRYCTDVRI